MEEDFRKGNMKDAYGNIRYLRRIQTMNKHVQGLSGKNHYSLQYKTGMESVLKTNFWANKKSN